MESRCEMGISHQCISATHAEWITWLGPGGDFARDACYSLHHPKAPAVYA